MKKLLCVICVLFMLIGLVGCGNQQLFDATYTYDYAYISRADGTVIEGKVVSWKDYDGEQLQITLVDSVTGEKVTYLTSSLRCDLVKY